MKTRLTFALLSALALTSLALAQPPGGGQNGQDGQNRSRRNMVSSQYIEHSWAVLCFEVGLSNEQFGKLKPTYVWAYKARNDAAAKMRETRDFAALGNTLNYVKKILDERIPTVLTATQKTAWQKWQAEQEARRQQMMQRAQARRGQHGQGQPQQ